ncbi:MAG: hypothetical protein RLP09_28210 [Sandaracinaceae bacterium]|nr:MAG: hypothetical protein EVA89_10010 [Sandaracinaceae bacterium]
MRRDDSMGYRVNKVGSMLVVRWQDMTLGDITAVRDEVNQFHRELGKPVVYVSITEDGSKPPDDDVRKAMVRSAESLMPVLAKLYVVIDTGGFMGSVHRSALAGMLLVSKLRNKVKVVKSLDEVLSLAAGDIGLDPNSVRSQLSAAGMATG